MKDVARLAGVSVATVSAVINRKKTSIVVSQRSRDKVFAAVQQLNYRVNEQARNLRRGKSHTIGVVVSDITQPFSGEMLFVLEREIASRGYDFLISDTQNNPERERHYLGLFQQKRIDGILFVGASNQIDDQGILRLVDSGTPIVLTEREVAERNVPCVLVDNVRGGRLATEHLLTRGYRRLAYITGPSGNVISEQRLAGFRTALMQCSDVESEQIQHGGIGLADGFESMSRLLDRPDRPEAVFCFNDALAIGSIKAATERQLQISADIGLVGYDDIAMAAYCVPSLTTIHQPILQMCEEGVGLLLDILDDKEPADYGRKAVLEPELVVRETSGGPRLRPGVTEVNCLGE